MNDALITIVSLSASGSILALILFAGKPLLKNRVSKAFSYYMWLLVLIRLVVPIAAPINVMGSLFGIEQPSMNNMMLEQTGIPTGSGTIQTDGQAAVPSNTQAVSQEPQNDNARDTQAPVDTQRLFTAWDFIKNNLLWIWLAGSAVSLGWFITAYACFSRRIRRSCVAPHSDDLVIFEQTLENKRVRVACSSRVATPMFVGVLRPVIVLPQLAYVRNGMDRELMNILRHELTHYRRKDVLYKWLVVAVTSMHWFNPLMLLIRKEISRACELSCDEAVISGMSADEKQSYGNTLLALSANRKLSAGIFATTLCEDKKELKERLVSIMRFKKKSTWAVALTFVLMLLLTGCAATLGAANTMAPSDGGATGSYSKIDSTDSLQQNEKPSLADSTKNSTTTATTTGEVNSTEETGGDVNNKNSITPQTAKVSGKVKLYEGRYFDESNYGDHILTTYCEVVVSNVTNTSFDFTIYQSNAQTGEKKVIFLKNTAVFIEDGTKAAFYGKDYTLNFTFPNGHGAYPVVTDMKISGFEPLEGKIYVNNGIPGHEFG